MESSRWVCLSETLQAPEHRLSGTQREILKILADYPDGVPVTTLQKKAGGKNLLRDLDKLHTLQLISAGDRIEKAAVTRKQETRVALRAYLPADIRLTEKQKSICDFLETHGTTALSALRLEFKNVHATINRMERKGLIDLSTREVYRSPAPVTRIGAHADGIRLNTEQKKTLAEIVSGIGARRYLPCLLHGVTGSGKTEVYLKAIEEALARGGSAIYLVPEITLTPQLMSRIEERFDKTMIAVLHSGIGRSARYDEWRRI